MSNNYYQNNSHPYSAEIERRNRSTTDIVAEQVVIGAAAYASASIIMWFWNLIFGATPFNRRRANNYKAFLNQTSGTYDWRDYE